MSKTVRSVFQKYSVLIFRVFLSLIFIVASLKHIFLSAIVTERLMSIEFGSILAGYVDPTLLVISSGMGMLIAGWALLLGYQTKPATLVLIVILVPITLTVQTQGMHTTGPLFKNIGLLGGLIYFLANGSCQYSFDQKLKKIQQIPFTS